MGMRRLSGLLACVGVMLALALPAGAQDRATVESLEKGAREDVIAGAFGAADEKVRAAINLAGNTHFNRLVLLQALIATHMGADGRSLLGAGIAAHESNDWPRPVIGYLLEERKLQEVATDLQRSGEAIDVKLDRLCELSFYAGAFANADGKAKFGKALLEKALKDCAAASPFRALAQAELTRPPVE